MTRPRPWWLPACLTTGFVFALATAVLGTLAFLAMFRSWHASAQAHAGDIQTFQVFGIAALVAFKMAFLSFLIVNARSNMDRTYLAEVDKTH